MEELFNHGFDADDSVNRSEDTPDRSKVILDQQHDYATIMFKPGDSRDEDSIEIYATVAPPAEAMPAPARQISDVSNSILKSSVASTPKAVNVVTVDVHREDLKRTNDDDDDDDDVTYQVFGNI